MKNLQELIKNIEQWAEDRNLIKGSTPKKQFIKLMEEFGELCSGVSKNKIDVIKDSIGDCFIVLTILAKQNGTNIYQSEKEVERIYNGLKDRLYENETIEYSICHISEGIGGLGRTFILTGNINEDVKKRRILFVLSGLVYITYNYNIDFWDCVKAAWDEIKDRKGRMVDGVFVKEGDL